MGQIITFYSYKGGVGRTMALVNVAVLLSKWRYKILMVDWDLEAPELEFYFKDYLNIKKAQQTPGVIELLHGNFSEISQGAPLPDWSSFCIEINLSKIFKNSVPLHFLTAGKRDNDYFSKVRDFDVENFYAKNGGFFIEALRDEWKKVYDFILIDSRTGITDSNGICTIQLPDNLVLLFTAIEQSYRATIDIAKKANLAIQKLPVDRPSLLSLPIPCRFDATVEFERSQEWLDRFSKELSEIYAYWLPNAINKRNFLDVTKIPYVAYFSFGENLPVVEKGTTDPQGLGYAYETLAALIAHKFESAEQLLDDRSEFIKSVSEISPHVLPFYYGSPIPAELFIGRQKELKRIVNRITGNAQSTAVISESRSGKTSLLHYLAAPEVRDRLYGSEGKKMYFAFVDAHILGSKFDQAQFWNQALSSLHEQLIVPNPDMPLSEAWQICKENGFGAFVLERLFAQMQQAGYRLVLMIDEFDTLLHHAVLNNAEFFGSLRSLASRASAFSLVIAARQPLSRLNDETQAFNRTGSPYFNFLSEYILGPMTDKDVLELLRRAAGRFTLEEHEFIKQVAGGHPYLLQVAASALWEAYEDGEEDAASRGNLVAQQLFEAAVPMFNDTWRLWPTQMRMAMTAIVSTQAPELLDRQQFKQKKLLKDVRDFVPELRTLEKQGFICRAETMLDGWRIRPQVFLWWLTDELIRTVRGEQEFEEWLRTQELDGYLTKDQRRRLRETGEAIAALLKGDIVELIKAGVKRFVG